MSPRRRRRSRSGRTLEVESVWLEPARIVSFAAAGLFLVVAPQVLAGATSIAATAIALLATLVLSAIVLVHRAEGRELRFPAVFPVFVGGLAYTALQAVPMPTALIRQVLPVSAEGSRLAHHAVGLGDPSFVPLSLDPGGTLLAIVQGASLVATVASVHALRQRRGRTHVLRFVAASVCLVALVTILHVGVAATKVFGVYEPRYAQALGPVMNPNHLAGFMAFGIPLLLGFAMEARVRTQRIAWASLALLCFVVALVSRSRGGAAAALAGPPTLAVWVALGAGRARRGEGARLDPRALGAGAVFLGLAVGAFLYVVGGQLPADFHDTDLSKLELARRAFALVAESPLFGIGRGAFSSAFVAIHGTSERYTHAENLVAQWTAEWGLPVALMVAIGLGKALLRALSGARSRVHVGAIVGILAIAFQNLVDFSLEMSGIACVVAGTLAVLEPAAASETAPAVDGATSRGQGARAALAVALALAVLVLGPVAIRNDVERLVEGLGQRPRVSAPELSLLGARTASFHPREPGLFLALGAHGIASRWPYAMRSLNRAMELAPGWPAPHVVAAAYFLARGSLDQARIEVREAESRQRGAAMGLACELVARRPDKVFVLTMAPVRKAPRFAFLDAVATCPGMPGPLRDELDSMMVRAGDAPLGARLRDVERKLAAGDSAAAIAASEALVREQPLEPSSHLLRARAYEASHDVDRALRSLRGAEPHVTNPRPLLHLEAEIAVRARRPDAMRDAVERLRAVDPGSADAQAAALLSLGRYEDQLGNAGKAIAAYRDADSLSPATNGLQYAADIAQRQGQTALAAQLYAIVCDRGEPGSAACAARDRIRGSLRESSPFPGLFGDPTASPPSTP